MHTDRYGNSHRQKCATGSGKEAKIQEFMYRDKTNVEHTMYVYNSNNWSHWNSNKRFKEKFGSHTRKTFYRFTKTDICTLNITQYREYCSVKLEASAVRITIGSREVPRRNSL